VIVALLQAKQEGFKRPMSKDTNKGLFYPARDMGMWGLYC